MRAAAILSAWAVGIILSWMVLVVPLIILIKVLFT